MATTSKSNRNTKGSPPEKPDEAEEVSVETSAVKEQPADAAPEGDASVSLVDSHDRVFTPSPAGAVFTYAFEDGTGLKVWQHPLPKGKNRPAPEESAADTVNQWRARRIGEGGIAYAIAGNPDRVFTSKDVNALVEKFAAQANLDS